jgi:hypothetical protein
MNEIICPHCNKAFKVDETGYSEILKQVRNQEFDKEIHERLKRAQEVSENALKLAQKESAIDLQSVKAEKDLEIERLKSRLSEQELSINTEVMKAVSEVEKERDQLKSKLENANLEKINSENALKDKYETQIRDRDDAIERLKDMKAKLSTKMVGETLEKHCEIEFNKLRSTAFQNAYFEKDNDASGGSKGDYIFRDYDDNGTEIVSIMFEMKNESDQTATKKKNEDFLKELDKDRNEKKCEYAILVSLLESESEFYNTGIVDVFHKYPKMYVIRPQYFIQMITLLRNAAMRSLQYKNELVKIREQNIDITNFEDKLENFKLSISRNYELAFTNFEATINEIDKAIDRLEKAKVALQKFEKNLKVADNKAQDVTVKSLTRNNPTMAAKFAELDKND